MPVITYVTPDGTNYVVEAAPDGTLMNAAVNNDIPGIYGDCGGMRACATCHIYVDDPWIDIVGPASEGEQELLELAEDVRPNSRLGCQIKADEALNGLVVHVPEG